MGNFLILQFKQLQFRQAETIKKVAVPKIKKQLRLLELKRVKENY